ncbi:MAG: hypothetical protein HC911_02520 [Chloroflexaceae bacterium]|nr:hypothetical protein [Chloroflexaceae bacterium]
MRRLSFTAPRRTASTPPPVHATVDWERSLSHHWQHTPDADTPPLDLYTQQRQRDFGTPENLLTVLTLLEWRMLAYRLLARSDLAYADLRHTLADLLAQCQQALAFPQFVTILPLAQARLERGEQAPLEAQVAAQVQAGSAYAELLAWREQWRGVRLLSAPTPPHGVHTDRLTSPAADQVYALWLWYELLDMLQQRAVLIADHPNDPAPPDQPDQQPRTLRYTWQGCTYHICAVRDDSFTVQRSDPPPARVADQQQVYWREAGLVWLARLVVAEPPTAPYEALYGRLLAQGSAIGMLLTAVVAPPPAPVPAGYHVQLVTVAPPDQATPAAPAEQALTALLDATHAALSPPPALACHGMFLDSLSAVEQQAWLDLNLPAATPPSEILICPKPHTTPPRTDLVSRMAHCCQDGRICQIVGQAGAHKPVRPPRNATELLHELDHLFAHRPLRDMDDASITRITHQIEQLARRLAQLMGAEQRIEVFYHRLNDLGLAPIFADLDDPARRSLALAIFLVEQLDSVSAHDYAAPVMQIAGVLERLLQERILACPNLTGAAFKGKPSLGTLPFMRSKPERTEGDWERLLAHLEQVWQGQLHYDQQPYQISFDGFVTLLAHVRTIRNRAAHTTQIKRHEYTHFFQLTCQAGATQLGALPTLLLAWRSGPAPHG